MAIELRNLLFPGTVNTYGCNAVPSTGIDKLTIEEQTGIGSECFCFSKMEERGITKLYNGNEYMESFHANYSHRYLYMVVSVRPTGTFVCIAHYQTAAVYSSKVYGNIDIFPGR